MSDTLIIIPAFNEEWNVQGLIQSLREVDRDWDLLLINDGSTDATGRLAEMEGVFVAHLPFNLGIGGCVQTGFKFASKNNYKYAVQFDSDGQHLVGEIEKIIDKVRSEECDVAIGSRFLRQHNGYRSSYWRRVGIKVFEIISNVLIRQTITDSTSGFRAYNQKAIHFLSQNYPNDYPEPEAIILLRKNGFQLCEVFSKMKERQGGFSSLRRKGVFYMVKVSLAMFMTSIRPRIA